MYDMSYFLGLAISFVLAAALVAMIYIRRNDNDESGLRMVGIFLIILMMIRLVLLIITRH